MRTNWVRERLLSGGSAIGCFMGLGSPNVAELMAQAGFDWLLVETEHNALDSAEIQHMLMAMNGTETIPMVRVPSASPVFIQRALDIGAMGLVVPMVRTADEARAIVSATRYPPEGTRGFGPLRASGYTMDNEDYFKRSNDNTIVALIIETREAVENLEAIAEVPGVDVLYLGPADMSIALGSDPLHLPLPEVDAVLDRMLEVGRKTGVAVGSGVNGSEGVRTALAKGVNFVSYGTDYALMVNAVRAGLDAFRS